MKKKNIIFLLLISFQFEKTKLMSIMKITYLIIVSLLK